ncbi:hypothetical protein DERF_007394 [Dermatophagoides farinae]|uniref:Uncharacterized protein n=1 Tax=Dermatophagoides farinae TaxID=6954 RepID=A0A922I181_DERFA|nr:hypothetical protein DERF_007394 [Dermatophagoides farinae]
MIEFDRFCCNLSEVSINFIKQHFQIDYRSLLGPTVAESMGLHKSINENKTLTSEAAFVL